ncbi:MAG: FtsX-like permease family protein [Chloroherpetonaceae bacterium]|nr:FtsX-like permease family protein [Chloroherpetonaceae bacterium]
MTLEWEIATRFIFSSKNGRGKKASFLAWAAALGVSLGTSALIIALGIVNGFSEIIQSKLIGFGSHINVSHLGNKMVGYSKAFDSLLTVIPNIEAVSPYLQSKAILKAIDKKELNSIDAIILKGIDPKRDVSFLRNKIIAGKFLDEITLEDHNPTVKIPIVIGKKLASTLGVSIGEDLLIIGSKEEEESFYEMNLTIRDVISLMRLRKGTVIGIYETGLSQGFDEVQVFTNLTALQAFLKKDKMISGFDLRTNDFTLLGETERIVSQYTEYPMYSQTVFEQYSNIISWLKLQENIIPLLLIVLTVVASFNIISTLLIFVLERTEEIGILLTIGFDPKRIQRVFTIQAMIIGGIGIVIGNLLSFLLTILEKNLHIIGLPEETYYISELPLSFNPWHYLTVTILAFFVCYVASFIPSRIASRLKPVEALKL